MAEFDEQVAERRERLEVLEAELADKRQALDALRAEVLGLAAERDRLALEVESFDTVAGLNESQRAALAQTISVAGIPSETRLGRPGGS